MRQNHNLIKFNQTFIKFSEEKTSSLVNNIYKVNQKPKVTIFMPKPQEFEKRLKSELHAEHVEVEDSSGGCGQAFAVVVVSDLFEGKNRLARHRLVNGAVKDLITAVHSFTQKNYSPAEWAAQH